MSIHPLWSRVKRTRTCWLITHCVDAYGYSRVFVNGRRFRAHRLSWELTYGPIPPGMFVCHKCDVRNCVRPAHLFLGSHLDNIQDMVSKGRHAYQISAKLNDAMRTEICRRYTTTQVSQRALAREYGVSQRAIFEVIQKSGLPVLIQKKWKTKVDMNKKEARA